MVIPSGAAAAVGGENGTPQMVAMQIGEDTILAQGHGLPVEVVGLGRAPTVVAHAGPTPTSVSIAKTKDLYC